MAANKEPHDKCTERVEGRTQTTCNNYRSTAKQRLSSPRNDDRASELTPNDGYALVELDDDTDEEYNWEDDGNPEYDLFRTQFPSIGQVDYAQQPYIRKCNQRGGLGGHLTASGLASLSNPSISLVKTLNLGSVQTDPLVSCGFGAAAETGYPDADDKAKTADGHPLELNIQNPKGGLPETKNKCPR